ncbi:hypothetical protein M8J77_019098 [Diaphorina citri]|nr:hypothetical protein M8J77_019098 [Diaphorina citri]
MVLKKTLSESEDEDVSSSDGSSEEGKDHRTKPKTDDKVKGEEKNSRKTSEKESEEETSSDEENGKKNDENEDGKEESSDEDDTNNNKEEEDKGEKKSGRGNGKESNKDDTEDESEEEKDIKTDNKETDVKKSNETDPKKESSEEESENGEEDDKEKKINSKDGEEEKDSKADINKEMDDENVKTSTETSKSDGTSSDDNDVTVKRTGKKDTKHDQGKTAKDIENGKDKSDINVKRIAKDIVKDKEVSDEGKSSVNKDKEKVDEMKQSSKNLLEELRKKQGSKIEDKIKRLANKANKEVDGSQRKITGVSKNVDLKAKLEENFKKHATKKGEEENLGKGLVNMICKDIIAAKKESMERRLDRSKVDETTPSVKKIQKLNLDLKSKLEQGLDFNKTRRTIAESLEKRRLTESTDNRRISGAIEKRLAESTEDGRIGNRLLAEPTEGLRRSRTTGEVEIGRDREREDREVRRQTDLTRQVKSSLVLDLESVLRNKATPQLSSKRKSVNGRKLRPKSVVDTAERGSADDIPDLLPSLPTSAEESLDSVTELPGSSQLQHLVKSRPRRAKTRAPTRATPLLSAQNSIPRLEDEGLDSFFIATPSVGSGGGSVNHTPVLSPLSDDSSLSSAPDTPNHTAPSDPQTPSTASSHCFSNTTTGKTTTLPHLKSKVTSADDVPRSRSSDNVGTSAGFGKRANTVDLSEPFSDSTPTSSSVSKIDGTHHLKRNTKLTGTAVDLIKAKKSAVDSCKDSTNTSTESSTSSLSTSSLSTSISTSTSNNITVSSIVKLRSAGLTDGLKSPTNGIPPKSPLPSKYSKEKGFEFGANADKSKGPTAALLGGAKPRPWSMMDHGEHKTDYKNLSALDINSSSGPSSLPLNINEKRSSVKAMAANLNKQGSESPEVKKKPTIEFPPPPSTGSGD